MGVGGVGGVKGGGVKGTQLISESMSCVPIVFGTDVAWDLRSFPLKKNTNLWHALCAGTLQ